MSTYQSFGLAAGLAIATLACPGAPALHEEEAATIMPTS